MSASARKLSDGPMIRLRIIPAVQTAIVSTLLVAANASSGHADMLGLRAAYEARSGQNVVAGAVEEASRRFRIPVEWVRAVMRVESDGDAKSVSEKGAIGLMQLMPKTYAELRAKLGLGSDPFDPRDNILAGAAYLSEMFERYGATGFLAAYNAGPRRYEESLFRGRPLPAETMDYITRLTPRLGLAGASIVQKDELAVARHRSILSKSVAVNLSNDSFPKRAAMPSNRPCQAAPHPLFSASFPNKLFADRPQFFGGPKTPNGAVHLQPSGLFVARIP